MGTETEGGLNEGENLQKLRKKGLNEVWWEMREVSRDCNHPEHFSNNQFFLGFLIQLIFSSHGPWVGAPPALAQGRTY